MSDVDQIISIRKVLSNIWEADETQMPAATPEMPVDPTQNQDQLDKDVDDVMTTPKVSSPDDDELVAIADDLGLNNSDAFVQAFDAMRSGIPNDDQDISTIVDAFSRLMSADASTVQKTINRLREIYDKPMTA